MVGLVDFDIWDLTMREPRFSGFSFLFHIDDNDKINEIISCLKKVYRRWICLISNHYNKCYLRYAMKNIRDFLIDLGLEENGNYWMNILNESTFENKNFRLFIKYYMKGKVLMFVLQFNRSM